MDRLIRESTQSRVATVSVSAQSTSHKAVYQYGLAPIIVGLSSKGSPIGYRFVLLATIPASIEDVDEVRIRSVIPDIVEPIASQLRSQIDSLPGLEERDATSTNDGENLSQHFEKYKAQMDAHGFDAFAAAARQFQRQFARKFPKYSNRSFLAIGLRPCAEPICSLSGFAYRNHDRSTDRFGKLYGWMKSRGLTSPNQAFILDSKGSFWAITASLDKGYEWEGDFPKPLLQAALVNAAKRARRTGVALSYTAPELAGLSREAVAHIADGFDSAYAAGIHLPSNPNTVLQGISDELGRARLTECVRLRGTFDASQAGKCAGYNLTPTIIAECLSGGVCTPPFGGQVNLDSLTIDSHMTLSYLSQNANLPRIPMGTSIKLVRW